ncbi:hypothetical protein [Nocardia sp. CC201C]|uniref:hypothetical protein n=1 Tax=Nocardia sp. CC201C TaxID=3044575 RepID=UPI0024A8E1EB|nr:hypothetical protein [Nocardia sp. CC201C]
MSWTVYSRTHIGRWLNWKGRDWKADAETTAALTTPGFAFPLTPTGPVQRGYGPGESELLAAALAVIPAPRTAGPVPEYPRVPTPPDGAIS